jgi:hypothetical protein
MGEGTGFIGQVDNREIWKEEILALKEKKPDPFSRLPIAGDPVPRGFCEEPP